MYEYYVVGCFGVVSREGIFFPANFHSLHLYFARYFSRLCSRFYAVKSSANQRYFVYGTSRFVPHVSSPFCFVAFCFCTFDSSYSNNKANQSVVIFGIKLKKIPVFYLVKQQVNKSCDLFSSYAPLLDSSSRRSCVRYLLLRNLV